MWVFLDWGEGGRRRKKSGGQTWIMQKIRILKRTNKPMEAPQSAQKVLLRRGRNPAKAEGMVFFFLVGEGKLGEWICNWYLEVSKRYCDGFVVYVVEFYRGGDDGSSCVDGGGYELGTSRVRYPSLDVGISRCGGFRRE